MKEKSKGDFFLVAVLLVLILFGCIMVFSASYPQAISEKGNLYFYFKKHVVSVGLGLIAFSLATFFPLKWLKFMSPVLFLVAIGLILLTRTKMGVSINEARRWINVFDKFTIMPAEIMKFAAINLMVAFLSMREYLQNNILNRIVPAFSIIVVSGALIYSTEDLSSAITLVLSLSAVLAFGGLKLSEVFAFSVGGAGLSYYMYHRILKNGGFRAKRLIVWRDPFLDPMDKGWQSINSYYAFSLGGILGVGLGQSKQKFQYLPEAFSDFIFAIIGEELGLLGCVFVCILFFLLVWRGIKIAMMQSGRFEMLLALGITALIAIQSTINISVTIGLVPNTGIPLPFISYGGTSMIIFLGMAGILFNLSRNRVAQQS